MRNRYNAAERGCGRNKSTSGTNVKCRLMTDVALLSNAPTLAAKAATMTIPIVFAVGQDPVRMGLVASLARPGGNATGINFFNQEAVAKRLGLLHDLVPKAVRIAVLVNPANASATEPTLREIQEAARVLGLLQIAVLHTRNRRGAWVSASSALDFWKGWGFGLCLARFRTIQV
jgi:ABC transporter substrate binding protein